MRDCESARVRDCESAKLRSWVGDLFFRGADTPVQSIRDSLFGNINCIYPIKSSCLKKRKSELEYCNAACKMEALQYTLETPMFFGYFLCCIRSRGGIGLSCQTREILPVFFFGFATVAVCAGAGSFFFQRNSQQQNAFLGKRQDMTA